MNKNKITTQQLVGTAILAAVVIILQLISSGIHVGPFTITLVLIPIIIGAVLYGPWSGAVLGALFGLIVCFAVVSGADVGGAILFVNKPLMTIFICIVKSSAAGYLAGLVARALSKKDLYLGVVLAAITAPVVNTGIFVISVVLCFKDIIAQWATAAGQVNILSYVFFGLVGANFLIELLVDVVMVPVIVRIIKGTK